MNNQVGDSLQVEFHDNNILSSLFGIHDSNIQLLEKMNNVKIEYRGNIVKISGQKISIQETKMTLQKLTNRSIDLYLTDDNYKNKLEKHDNLISSGSNL